MKLNAKTIVRDYEESRQARVALTKALADVAEDKKHCLALMERTHLRLTMLAEKESNLVKARAEHDSIVAKLIPVYSEAKTLVIQHEKAESKMLTLEKQIKAQRSFDLLPN